MLPTSQKPGLQRALNASSGMFFSTLTSARRTCSLIAIHSVAFVAQVFPCLVCIGHSHITDRILARTCTDVFDNILSKEREKVVQKLLQRIHLWFLALISPMSLLAPLLSLLWGAFKGLEHPQWWWRENNFWVTARGQRGWGREEAHIRRMESTLYVFPSVPFFSLSLPSPVFSSGAIS